MSIIFSEDPPELCQHQKKYPFQISFCDWEIFQKVRKSFKSINFCHVVIIYQNLWYHLTLHIKVNLEMIVEQLLIGGLILAYAVILIGFVFYRVCQDNYDWVCPYLLCC